MRTNNISNFKFSSILHRKGQTRVFPLATPKQRGTKISYLLYSTSQKVSGTVQTTIPVERSHGSSNISDLRLASTSRAAVSNVMVVLRLSNRREVSIGFQSQNVRHSDDLQRREFLNRDRRSINLIKMGGEVLGSFFFQDRRARLGKMSVPTGHANASYSSDRARRRWARMTKDPSVSR